MIQLIEKYICDKRGIDDYLLHTGKYHKREISETRQMIVYLAVISGMTYAEAGAYFNVYKSNVNYIMKRMINAIRLEPSFAQEMAQYEKYVIENYKPSSLYLDLIWRIKIIEGCLYQMKKEIKNNLK